MLWHKECSQCASPALHLPVLRGQRVGLGMLLHQSQKATQAGDPGCTHTWASGHAADQNWTLARSQEVKSKMEGMGHVLADRVRNQTQPTSGPLLLLGTLALGFMVPGLGGCYPPHLATARKDGVWHDG